MFDSLDSSNHWNEHASLEEYTTYLSGRDDKNIQVIQCSKGKFYSKYRHVRLDKFSVAIRESKSAYIARLVTDINSYTFNVYECLNGHFINGHRAKNGSLYMIRPGQELLINSNENTKHLSLKIDKKILDEYLDISDLICDDAFAIQVTETERLHQLFSSIVFSIFLNNKKLSRQVIKDIEENGLYNLIKILCKDNVLEVLTMNHHRIVRRAQEYIDSHYLSKLSVLDLYKHSHCSLRTLEYAFKKVLGLTPKGYLILLRMHDIRKEIVNHCEVNRSLLLDKYGVQNHSRFYGDYRELFGEDSGSKYE
jgi:AraC-like DNA-binding protein